MGLRGDIEVLDFYENDSHISQRSGLNLKEGQDIGITAVDDPANNRVDYTIDAFPPAATSTISMYDDGTLVAEQSGINLAEGSNVTITSVEDAGNNRVNYTISSASNGFDNVNSGFIPFVDWFSNNSGSGSDTLRARSAVVRTGSNAASRGGIWEQFEVTTDNFFTRDQRWAWTFEPRLTTGDGEMNFWVGCSTDRNRPAPSDKLLGFIVENQSLFGVVSDQTSMNLVDLSYAVTIDKPVKVELDLDTATGTVTFYVNGTVMGSTTTDVPTGASGGGSIYTCITAQNNNDGSETFIQAYQVDYEIAMP